MCQLHRILRIVCSWKSRSLEIMAIDRYFNEGSDHFSSLMLSRLHRKTQIQLKCISVCTLFSSSFKKKIQMSHVFDNIHLAEYLFPVGVIIKQNSEHFDILIVSNTVYGVLLFLFRKTFKN